MNNPIECHIGTPVSTNFVDIKHDQTVPQKFFVLTLLLLMQEVGYCMFKFRCGTHGLNEELGTHREGKVE